MNLDGNIHFLCPEKLMDFLVLGKPKHRQVYTNKKLDGYRLFPQRKLDGYSMFLLGKPDEYSMQDTFCNAAMLVPTCKSPAANSLAEPIELAPMHTQPITLQDLGASTILMLRNQSCGDASCIYTDKITAGTFFFSFFFFIAVSHVGELGEVAVISLSAVNILWPRLLLLLQRLCSCGKHSCHLTLPKLADTFDAILQHAYDVSLEFCDDSPATVNST